MQTPNYSFQQHETIVFIFQYKYRLGTMSTAQTEARKWTTPLKERLCHVCLAIEDKYFLDICELPLELRIKERANFFEN